MALPKILLFYVFTPLPDPDAIRVWQLDLCRSLGLRGSGTNAAAMVVEDPTYIHRCMFNDCGVAPLATAMRRDHLVEGLGQADELQQLP